MVTKYLSGPYADIGKYGINWCADIRYEDSVGVLLGLHHMLANSGIWNLQNGVDWWITTDPGNI